MVGSRGRRFLVSSVCGLHNFGGKNDSPEDERFKSNKRCGVDGFTSTVTREAAA
jgi:hypothetical protein